MEVTEMLREFGFTEAESAVYVFLLQESPATGYRAAQAVGRPLSQTYKAIEALARKGAILVDDGATRLCRAVSPAEFFSQLERTFKKRVDSAKELFQKVPKQSADHRLYQIESYEEVLDRTFRMLERCRQVAIVDVFPEPLLLLRDAIEKLLDRGRRVALKTYEPTDVRATLKTVLSKGKLLMDIWPGEILNIVIDGSEFLSALINVRERKVSQAIWSANAFLSAREHNGLSCEIGLTIIQGLLLKNAPRKELVATFKLLDPFFVYKSPVFKTLSKKK